MSGFESVYVESFKKGVIKERAETARHILQACMLCPRECAVNRLSGETGICKTAHNAVVSSYHPHFGEEAPLVGKNGSGTIFFTHCNLLCNFCQNYDISHLGYGREVTDEELAGIMLSLQDEGCHNINFVTPTHIVPQILSAVEIAAGNGLSIPLIYNTSAYDNVETLKLLDGIIDIYMPDFKFWDSEAARITCQAPDYPQKACLALKEMHRQVGDLAIDKSGIAKRGLLIRHLVMPENFAGTSEIMSFIAKEISPNSYVNIMPQYRPCGEADKVKELSRYPSEKEIQEALAAAANAGLGRL